MKRIKGKKKKKMIYLNAIFYRKMKIIKGGKKPGKDDFFFNAIMNVE